MNCGWSVEGVTVPTQDTVTVTAQVSLSLAGQEAVDGWLKAAAAATTEAVSDAEVSGASYPVQRLRDIQITTPARTVGGTALPVTLLPVWPSGPDPVNPLFTSPSVGAPSAMLDAVAGGTAGVRFSDGCAGALTVSSDGLVVTALSVAPDCTVRARVGNFTDLVSGAEAARDSSRTPAQPAGTATDGPAAWTKRAAPATHAYPRPVVTATGARRGRVTPSRSPS
ncbi:MAG: serine/threonine protein kinase [Microbacterium sp.]|nr:serine/threonine protein kinase [Microbacterium sp.]